MALPAGPRTQARAGDGRAVVFAESEAALAWARASGLLPEAAEIVSASPHLVLSGRARPVDAERLAQRYTELNALVVAFAWDVFAACREAGLREMAAIAAARTALYNLGSQIHRVLQLTEDDVARAALALTPAFPRAALQRRFEPGPASVLADSGRLERVMVPAGVVGSVADALPPVASLRMRLRFASAASVGYRIATEVFARTGLVTRKGTFLVHRESELVKEAAFRLVMRGHTIRPLRTPGAMAAVQGSAVPAQAITALFESRFAKEFGPTVRSALREAFQRELAESLAALESAHAAWSSALRASAKLAPQGVLTNAAIDPVALGLSSACREIGLPVFAFHHGIAVEFSQSETDYFARHENTAADVAFCFNDTAKQVLDQSPYPHGRTVPVGLPREYFQGAKLPSHPEITEICYASTGLYCGNLPPGLAIQCHDVGMARLEIEVVDKVLGRLPHKVLYKPYPARRYLDPDPVIERVKATPSIGLFTEGIDLRYIARRSRVLVTSRATSTIVWCLLSGRPTVFIDVADQLPLRADTREALSAAAFVFETRREGWADEMRELLSRPLAEIERNYQEKSQARDAFMARYLSPHRSGAGERAAMEIIRHVASIDRRNSGTSAAATGKDNRS